MVEIGIFAAQTFIILISIALLILLIAFVAAKANEKPELEVEPLHTKYRTVEQFLKSFSLSKDELKVEKKRLNEESKKQEEAKGHQKKVFVINFDGDMKASQAENLREEISAVLLAASPQDEVVVKLESPGGMVHGYGFAASQLLRIRDKGIPLTICVDKVAASGGYMMACVGSQILAAPFAIIGSIGVVAQVPNINKLLKKHDVEYKEYTAGEYKRTVSFMGEITPKGEQKFQDQLEETHSLFKKFVGQYRPQLKMEDIATGEYWYGTIAKEHHLVDKIMTSDDYLLSLFKDGLAIFEVNFHVKQKLMEKLSDALGKTAFKYSSKFLEGLMNQKNI